MAALDIMLAVVVLAVCWLGHLRQFHREQTTQLQLVQEALAVPIRHHREQTVITVSFLRLVQQLVGVGVVVEQELRLMSPVFRAVLVAVLLFLYLLVERVLLGKDTLVVVMQQDYMVQVEAAQGALVTPAEMEHRTMELLVG